MGTLILSNGRISQASHFFKQFTLFHKVSLRLPPLGLELEWQSAKKVMSDSPGLVDFAIRRMIFVLNLPDRQVLFLEGIQITKGL